MTDKDPRTVSPSEILGRVQASTSGSQLARKLLRRIEPPGTPNAKMRLGLVVTFDPATWTCTAMIGDQLTQVSGIKVLAGVVPVANCAGYFSQVGGDSTTEYTLIGMLAQGPGTVRIRKTANQSIFNSGSNNDSELKFQGIAGRTYLFEFMLIAFQNTGTASLDIKVGWTLPAGATWSGGGPGPATTIATGASTEVASTANWRAAFGTTGALLPYGIEGSAGVGIDGFSVAVPLQGSIEMGANSGLCSVAWVQNGPATATTTVREGSFLKVDMTSE